MAARAMLLLTLAVTQCKASFDGRSHRGHKFAVRRTASHMLERSTYTSRTLARLCSKSYTLAHLCRSESRAHKLHLVGEQLGGKTDMATILPDALKIFTNTMDIWRSDKCDDTAYFSHYEDLLEDMSSFINKHQEHTMFYSNANLAKLTFRQTARLYVDIQSLLAIMSKRQAKLNELAGNCDPSTTNKDNALRVNEIIGASGNIGGGFVPLVGKVSLYSYEIFKVFVKDLKIYEKLRNRYFPLDNSKEARARRLISVVSMIMDNLRLMEARMKLLVNLYRNNKYSTLVMSEETCVLPSDKIGESCITQEQEATAARVHIVALVLQGSEGWKVPIENALPTKKKEEAKLSRQSWFDWTDEEKKLFYLGVAYGITSQLLLTNIGEEAVCDDSEITAVQLAQCVEKVFWTRVETAGGEKPEDITLEGTCEDLTTVQEKNCLKDFEWRKPKGEVDWWDLHMKWKEKDAPKLMYWPDFVVLPNTVLNTLIYHKGATQAQFHELLAKADNL